MPGASVNSKTWIQHTRHETELIPCANGQSHEAQGELGWDMCSASRATPEVHARYKPGAGNLNEYNLSVLRLLFAALGSPRELDASEPGVSQS